MRKIILAHVCWLLIFSVNARSGTLNSSQADTAPASAPNGWYAERELNLQLWGTYALTANNYNFEDQYLNADHAWGGGLDAKYFFNRHVGIGLQGYAASATQTVRYANYFLGVTTYPTIRDQRIVGAGLATVTLRCPIGNSRFAPYVFAGGGFIAGGGQRLRGEFVNLVGTPAGTNPIRMFLTESKTEAVGQFGGGVEIRLTKHIGIINDFGWNVVNGRDNDFGMARSGINLAF
jgi:hypothetical protein